MGDEPSEHLRNVTHLVGIAEKRHHERIRDSEVLDRKLWLVMAAHAFILLRLTTDIRSEHWPVLTAGILVAILGLTVASVVYWRNEFVDTPSLRPLFEKHIESDHVGYLKQVLARYDDAITTNVSRGKAKGNGLRLSLILLAVGLLFLVVVQLMATTKASEDPMGDDKPAPAADSPRPELPTVAPEDHDPIQRDPSTSRPTAPPDSGRGK